MIKSRVDRQSHKYLSFIDWDQPDARARYMRAMRILRGDKKSLSPVEKEFKLLVLRVHALINEEI